MKKIKLALFLLFSVMLCLAGPVIASETEAPTEAIEETTAAEEETKAASEEKEEDKKDGSMIKLIVTLIFVVLLLGALVFVAVTYMKKK